MGFDFVMIIREGVDKLVEAEEYGKSDVGFEDFVVDDDNDDDDIWMEIVCG